MPNYTIYSHADSKEKGLTVTGTNTYYSKAVYIDGEPVSFHPVWTETVASLTGAFTLWYSNKPNPDVSSDTDWVQDTTFPAPTVSGTGKAFVSAAQVTALRVRLKYVNATGTGTLLCFAQTAEGRS